MPIPTPNKDENQEQFLHRCITDNVMRSEFPDGKQRFVVCLQQWENRNN